MALMPLTVWAASWTAKFLGCTVWILQIFVMDHPMTLILSFQRGVNQGMGLSPVQDISNQSVIIKIQRLLLLRQRIG